MYFFAVIIHETGLNRFYATYDNRYFFQQNKMDSIQALSYELNLPDENDNDFYDSDYKPKSLTMRVVSRQKSYNEQFPPVQLHVELGCISSLSYISCNDSFTPSNARCNHN